VAKRLAVMNVSYRLGRIKITEAAIPKNRQRADANVSPNRGSQKLADAIMAIRLKLGEFHNMVDLIKPRFILAKISRASLDNAYGFRARIAGIGQAFVVRPEAVRHWLPSSVSVRQAVKQLDSSGYLIRGCDGKLTRQVKLWGLSRRRYYCFKLLTATNNAAVAALMQINSQNKLSDKARHSTSKEEDRTLLQFKRPKPTGPFAWND